MRSVQIRTGERFTLTSHGNGLNYTLMDQASKQDVYIHGDNAANFREELDAIEAKNPEWLVDQVLGWLWDQCGYEGAAEPIT